jgi:hypothetical protein
MTTYKLKFGHRGANHPVKDLRSGGSRSRRRTTASPCARRRRRTRRAHVTTSTSTTTPSRGCRARPARLLGPVPPRGDAPGPHDARHLFARFAAEMERFARPWRRVADAAARRPEEDPHHRLGPIVIGQACEFDYSGTQACRVLLEDGFEVVLVNSNPATIMTDPDFATRTYVEPLDLPTLTRIIEIERPDALLPTLGGQTALNLSIELAEAGVLDLWGVEMIGADVEAIRRAEDRALFRETMEASACACRAARWRTRSTRPSWPPPSSASRWSCARPSRSAAAAAASRTTPRACAASSPAACGAAHHAGAARGVGRRLARVRARGHARRRRQRGRHLLDRERRPDGRAHRRQRDRRAGAHADRPAVPGAARRRARRGARDRRRHRRLERAVRRAPRDRRGRRHRDEPARVAQLGAGLQGDRLPDRQDRRQAGRRLHARRDRQRHHEEDPGLLRADARLRGRQDAAVGLREVPAGRPPS